MQQNKIGSDDEVDIDRPLNSFVPKWGGYRGRGGYRGDHYKRRREDDNSHSKYEERPFKWARGEDD